MDIGSLLNAKSPDSDATPNQPQSRHQGSRRQSHNSNSSMHNQNQRRISAQYNNQLDAHLASETADALQIFGHGHLEHNESDIHMPHPAGISAQSATSSYGSIAYQNMGPLGGESSTMSGPSTLLDSGPDNQDSIKPFPCSYVGCLKGFARRSDLVRHERIHSGERPHCCDFPGCDKHFIQRSALTVHKRVHTREKPHHCKDCGKPFSDSSSLARHRRTHLGTRPYRCEYADCQKTFTRKTTLTRHQSQHTNGADGPSTRNESLSQQTHTRGSITDSITQCSDENDLSDASSVVTSEHSYSRRSSDNTSGTIGVQRHISAQSQEGISQSSISKEHQYVTASSPTHYQTQSFQGIAQPRHTGMPHLNSSVLSHQNSPSHMSSHLHSQPHSLGVALYDNQYFPRSSENDRPYQTQTDMHNIQPTYYTHQPEAMTHPNVTYDWSQRPTNHLWTHSPQ